MLKKVYTCIFRKVERSFLFVVNTFYTCLSIFKFCTKVIASGEYIIRTPIQLINSSLHLVQTFAMINEQTSATFQNVLNNLKQQPVFCCKHFVSGLVYFVTGDRFCQISTTDWPSIVIKAINCELRHRFLVLL